MAKSCLLTSKISHKVSQKYAELDNELVNNVMFFFFLDESNILPHMES